jgi:hypothetical protein
LEKQNGETIAQRKIVIRAKQSVPMRIIRKKFVRKESVCVPNNESERERKRKRERE